MSTHPAARRVRLNAASSKMVMEMLSKIEDCETEDRMTDGIVHLTTEQIDWMMDDPDGWWKVMECARAGMLTSEGAVAIAEAWSFRRWMELPWWERMLLRMFGVSPWSYVP